MLPEEAYMIYNLSSLGTKADWNAGAQNTKHDAMRCSHAISLVSAMFIFNVSETWTLLSHGSSREHTPLHAVAKKPSNSMLNRMFVPNTVCLKRWRKLHIERHRNLYSSPYTLKVIAKSTRIRIMKEMKNPYRASWFDW